MTRRCQQVGYCTQVSVKRTARGRRNGWRSTHAGLPRTATGQLTVHRLPLIRPASRVTNVPPNLLSLEPGLDSLQADGDRVRISPGFACPSCLVQSRCLRSVTVSGRRLRFVLLVAVGPEVPRVTTHSDRGLGWNLVPLRTRGITRSLTMHGLPISESPLHSAPILPRSVHGFEQLNVSRVILAAGNLTSPWAWVMRSVTTLLHPRYARNEQILVRKVARNAPPWGARGRPKRPERSNPGLWGAGGGTYRRLCNVQP